MEKTKLGVGIIGASTNGTWGGLAHVPALLSLPEYQLVAISTTRRESANETARQFAVPYAFTDPFELAAHPEVDMVSITVKVPDHHKLVQTALEAGKSVYCEFPLGRTSEEAADMLKNVEAKGVRHFVGLQSRANPSLRYLKDLIADGYIGDVRAIHCNYALPLFPSRSKQINRSRVYMLDKANGANHLTITAGHFLDGIAFLVGAFSEVSAIMKTDAAHIPVVETEEIVAANATDHVSVSGILTNGAIISCHVRNTYTGSLSIEISGTEGDLVLQSRENFMFQIDSFAIKGARHSKVLEDLPVPVHYNILPAGLTSGPSFNVASLYKQIYADLRNDTHEAPDFRTALTVHKLIDAVQKSADTGTRITL